MIWGRARRKSRKKISEAPLREKINLKRSSSGKNKSKKAFPKKKGGLNKSQKALSRKKIISRGLLQEKIILKRHFRRKKKSIFDFSSAPPQDH